MGGHSRTASAHLFATIILASLKEARPKGMNHLFTLIAMSVFQRRRTPAAWTLWALALGIAGFIAVLPNIVHADGAGVLAQRDACQTIIGLNPSEAEYAACTRSLNQSVAAAHDANDISLNPLERACAAVGIRPNSQTFRKCVVDLSSSLLKLESIPGR